MANPENYYSGQGILYVGDRDVNGNPTGLSGLCNVSALELSVDVTKFEHKESCSGARAIDLTIIQEKNVTFTMTLENVKSTNLAMALWGAASTVAGAAVTDEVITAKHDLVVPLAHTNLNSAVSVVVDDGGTPTPTTYTEGTDFTVDYQNGTITVLSTGAIADDATIEIDYTHLGYADVQAMTVTSLTKYLRFDGLNTVDGTPFIVDLYKASIDPVSAMQLINEEIMQLELTGNVLYDSVQTGSSKYFRVRKIDGT